MSSQAQTLRPLLKTVPPAERRRHSLRERLLMPVLFAPVFMVILDVFIVNVAAPSLREDLHATASEVQWVVAAYLLTYGISLITAGRLGDIFGRRRMFKIGVAGFTIASVLCAAAPSASALIVGRLVQGLAGAAMWPQVLSTVAKLDLYSLACPADGTWRPMRCNGARQVSRPYGRIRYVKYPGTRSRHRTAGYP